MASNRRSPRLWYSLRTASAPAPSKKGVLWSIAAAAFIAIFALKLPFPLIVIAAGVIGYIGGRIAPDKFATGGHGAAAQRSGAAIIDDHTPTPAHARFSWRRFLSVLLAG